MVKADKLAERVNVAPQGQTGQRPDQNAAPELPGMTLEFLSSGQLVTTTKLGKINSAKTGRWRMTQFTPPDEMTIKCHLDQQSTRSRELKVTWIDDQTIRMTPPNMSGQRMRLKFKKQP